MLNLQPLIARLVDDILRAVRSASIEELGALLSVGTVDAPTRARRKPASPPQAPKAPRARGARRRPAARPVAAEASARPQLPAVGEITDPERLLSAVTAPDAVVGPNESALPEADTEPPPSTVRPTVHAPAALRAGESLARAAGAGLVIRRAKRA